MKLAAGKLDRKCRSCAAVTTFAKGESIDVCFRCGRQFGKIVLGFDVSRKK